jgi:carbon monoxide dehydrogenase subunit G
VCSAGLVETVRVQDERVIFEDKVTINAPATKVWDFLIDPKCIAACMPGVENVTQVDDRTFDAAILASVGPISGKFTFRARIVESNPPTEMAAEVDGQDSVTKSPLTARVAMTLTPLSAAQTDLAYRATVEVKGRLAILGDMVLRATAALMMEEATRRLRTQLEAPGSGASGAVT